MIDLYRILSWKNGVFDLEFPIDCIDITHDAYVLAVYALIASKIKRAMSK